MLTTVSFNWNATNSVLWGLGARRLLNSSQAARLPTIAHLHPLAPHPTQPESHFTCSLGPPNFFEVFNNLERSAFQSYVQGSPNTDQLLSLSRLNVQRAIIDNISAIGMTMSWLDDDESLSIFNMSIPGYSEAAIPESLRPTRLQRETPHHPWLDFFPFPNMRDSMISARDSFDDEELCHDIMAFFDTRNSGATLLVWGNSWDPHNWEASEGFFKKWSRFLLGCPELLVSTNYWRARRGERPLNYKQLSSVGSSIYTPN